MAIARTTLEGFLRVRAGRLIRRESQVLEFKKSFNLRAMAEYFRDFAAFANNRGGYMVFGIEDSPRRPAGLSESAWDRFNSIDPRRITEPLLEMFAPDIRWELEAFEVNGKRFGVFRVHESAGKPVVARKNQGPVKDGEVYYRYRGQTQKIRHAEMESIIAARIESTNEKWRGLLKDIGQIGVNHAAVLDTTQSGMEGAAAKVLVIDENLGRKLNVPGGRYVPQQARSRVVDPDHEDSGDPSRVVWKVLERLTETYPYSAMEMAERVIERVPTTGRHLIWKVIGDHELKNDERYSAYNFRSNAQERKYKETGLVVPSATPSIYNDAAVDLIVEVLTDEALS